MESACLACPAGRYGNEPGKSNTTGEPTDYCPEACTAGQYLEGKQCKTCPDGAYCPEASDKTAMQALAGYWRVPGTVVFVECLHACSCLGAPNPQNVCPNRSVAEISHPEGRNTAKDSARLPNVRRLSPGTAATVGEDARNVEKRGSTFCSLSWWDVAYCWFCFCWSTRL